MVMLVLIGFVGTAWRPGGSAGDAPPTSPAPADAELVYVGNRVCPMSGSLIADEDLGRYQSFVHYDGPDARYRGKTLVFNQCCPTCVSAFAERWAQSRDAIMSEMGLVDR